MKSSSKTMKMNAEHKVEASPTLLDKVLHFTRGKMRVFLSWFAILILIGFIHQAPNWKGILVIFMGAFLRYFSSGYIDKEGKLSIGGPYKLVRNPLYVGSILIAMGAGLAQDDWLLTAILTVCSILMHLPIIWAEERVLTSKFGEQYRVYKANVPRLLPRPNWNFDTSKLLAEANINTAHFSWKTCNKNKGYEAFLVFLAVVAIQFGLWKLKEKNILPLPQQIQINK